MQPAVRRRYLALGALMRSRRRQREGHTRADIAANHAAGKKEHREQLIAKADAREAAATALREQLSSTARVTEMRDLHHFNMDELKAQLRIRIVLDSRRLNGKVLTLGGNRAEVLGRLTSVLLLENVHAADGYDVEQTKNFYKDG
jgi:hypothetical protein